MVVSMWLRPRGLERDSGCHIAHPVPELTKSHRGCLGTDPWSLHVEQGRVPATEETTEASGSQTGSILGTEAGSLNLGFPTCEVTVFGIKGD